MTDDERLALAERAWMENRHDERAYLLAFARALESRVLAERKEEPVAWRSKHKTGNQWTYSNGKPYVNPPEIFEVEPLYAAPLAQSAEQDRIDAERDALNALSTQSPIYAYEWDFSPGVVHRSFSSAPYNGRQPDRTLALVAAIAKGARK